MPELDPSLVQDYNGEWVSQEELTMRQALRAPGQVFGPPLGAPSLQVANDPAVQRSYISNLSNYMQRGGNEFNSYLEQELLRQGYTKNPQGQWVPPNSALTEADFQEGIRRIQGRFEQENPQFQLAIDEANQYYSGIQKGYEEAENIRAIQPESAVRGMPSPEPGFLEKTIGAVGDVFSSSGPGLGYNVTPYGVSKRDPFQELPGVEPAKDILGGIGETIGKGFQLPFKGEAALYRFAGMEDLARNVEEQPLVRGAPRAGRFLGEAVVPRTLAEAAIEFLPGIGAVPGTISAVGKATSGNLARSILGGAAREVAIQEGTVLRIARITEPSGRSGFQVVGPGGLKSNPIFGEEALAASQARQAAGDMQRSGVFLQGSQPGLLEKAPVTIGQGAEVARRGAQVGSRFLQESSDSLSGAFSTLFPDAPPGAMWAGIPGPPGDQTVRDTITFLRRELDKLDNADVRRPLVQSQLDKAESSLANIESMRPYEPPVRPGAAPVEEPAWVRTLREDRERMLASGRLTDEQLYDEALRWKRVRAQNDPDTPTTSALGLDRLRRAEQGAVAETMGVPGAREPDIVQSGGGFWESALADPRQLPPELRGSSRKALIDSIIADRLWLESRGVMARPEVNQLQRPLGKLPDDPQELQLRRASVEDSLRNAPPDASANYVNGLRRQLERIDAKLQGPAVPSRGIVGDLESAISTANARLMEAEDTALRWAGRAITRERLEAMRNSLQQALDRARETIEQASRQAPLSRVEENQLLTRINRALRQAGIAGRRAEPVFDEAGLDRFIDQLKAIEGENLFPEVIDRIRDLPQPVRGTMRALTDQVRQLWEGTGGSLGAVDTLTDNARRILLDSPDPDASRLVDFLEARANDIRTGRSSFEPIASLPERSDVTPAIPEVLEPEVGAQRAIRGVTEPEVAPSGPMISSTEAGITTRFEPQDIIAKRPTTGGAGQVGTNPDRVDEIVTRARDGIPRAERPRPIDHVGTMPSFPQLAASWRTPEGRLMLTRRLPTVLDQLSERELQALRRLPDTESIHPQIDAELAARAERDRRVLNVQPEGPFIYMKHPEFEARLRYASRRVSELNDPDDIAQLQEMIRREGHLRGYTERELAEMTEAGARGAVPPQPINRLAVTWSDAPGARLTRDFSQPEVMEILDKGTIHGRPASEALQANLRQQVQIRGLPQEGNLGGGPSGFRGIPPESAEPPVADGFVRLYRGEGRIERPPDAAGRRMRDAFPGLAERADNERGRWFSTDRSFASRFDESGMLRYIDVPKTDLEKFRVAEYEIESPEYLIPREVSDRAQYLVPFHSFQPPKRPVLPTPGTFLPGPNGKPIYPIGGGAPNQYVGSIRPLSKIIPEISTSSNPIQRAVIGQTRINPSLRFDPANTEITALNKATLAYNRQLIERQGLIDSAIAAFDAVNMREVNSPLLGIGFGWSGGGPFRLNAENLAEVTLARTGNKVRTPWQTIMEHPGDYLLTPEQTTVRDRFLKIIDEIEVMRVNSGLRDRRNQIKGIYVPHKVKEVYVRDKGWTPLDQDKQSSAKLSRLYRTVDRGIEGGKRYHDPRTTLQLQLEDAYNEVAYKGLISEISPYVTRSSELLKIKNPRLAGEFQTALDDWTLGHSNLTAKVEALNNQPGGMAAATQQDLMDLDDLEEIADRAWFKVRSIQGNVDTFYRRTQFQKTGTLSPTGVPEHIEIGPWGYDPTNPEAMWLEASHLKILEDGIGSSLRAEAGRGWGTGLEKGAEAIVNTMRTGKTGLDVGIGFIHLLPVLGRNPAAWGRAMWSGQIRSLLNPLVHARYIENNMDTLMRMSQYELVPSGNDIFEAIQQNKGISLSALESIPGGKAVRGAISSAGRHTFGRASTGMGAALTIARSELWKAMEPGFLKSGINEAMAEARSSMRLMPLQTAQNLQVAQRRGEELGRAKLAQHIRNMTGGLDSAALGVHGGQRAAEGAFVALSPRLLRSTIGLVSELKYGPQDVRGREAFAALAGIAGSTSILYGLTGIMMGKDEKEIVQGLMPWNGKKFLSHEIEGTWIGLGGQFRALTQVLGAFGAAAFGAKDELGRDLVNFEDWWSLNTAKNPFLRFYTTRSAPLYTFGSQIIEGATGLNTDAFDNINGPLDLAGTLIKDFLPFALTSFIEGEGLKSAMSGFVGFNANPETPTEWADGKVKDLVAGGGVPYRDPDGKLKYQTTYLDANGKEHPIISRSQLNPLAKEWFDKEFPDNLQGRRDKQDKAFKEYWDITDSLRNRYSAIDNLATEQPEEWRKQRGIIKSNEQALLFSDEKGSWQDRNKDVLKNDAPLTRLDKLQEQYGRVIDISKKGEVVDWNTVDKYLATLSPQDRELLLMSRLAGETDVGKQYIRDTQQLIPYFQATQKYWQTTQLAAQFPTPESYRDHFIGQLVSNGIDRTTAKSKADQIMDKLLAGADLARTQVLLQDINRVRLLDKWGYYVPANLRPLLYQR